jgi:hypothetical protein
MSSLKKADGLLATSISVRISAFRFRVKFILAKNLTIGLDACASFASVVTCGSNPVRQGVRLVVVPAEQAPLYTFFYPELGYGPASSNRIVMVITPYATGAQRQAAIAAYHAAGYEAEQERILGGS